MLARGSVSATWVFPTVDNIELEILSLTNRTQFVRYQTLNKPDQAYSIVYNGSRKLHFAEGCVVLIFYYFYHNQKKY